MIAVIFEAELSREQAGELARLMDELRPTRPAGVVTASLLYDDGVGRLIAYWQDRAALDRYRSQTPVLRGQELMRRFGVEPEVRVVEVLDFG